MIRTFAERATAAVFADERVRKYPAELLQMARRKLAWLDPAERIESLKVPPGTRIEALGGDRNDQSRFCFRFEDGHAYDVEFIDYH